MYSQFTWYCYYIKNYIRRYVQFRITQIRIKMGCENKLCKIRHFDKVKKIAGKKQMNIIEMNIRLADAICSNEPFWIGRYGGMERDVIISFLEEAHGMHCNKDNLINGLCNNAGFFPNDEQLVERFVQMMLGVCKHMDILGTWKAGFMEDYLVHEYMRDSCVTKLTYLEPWMLYFSKYYGQVKPWTYALRGKKVLVIHPFVETIENQYLLKRTKLFEGYFDSEDILPQFELFTLKAVQTQGGEIDDRFNDWFDALEWMKEEVAKIKFDVAIIGCGAYGFPLAAYIKSLGKVAIHMGGSTQLMFGIKGKRWENFDGARIFFREEWVRPSKKETISKASNVEDGCYW